MTRTDYYFLVLLQSTSLFILAGTSYIARAVFGMFIGIAMVALVISAINEYRKIKSYKHFLEAKLRDREYCEVKPNART